MSKSVIVDDWCFIAAGIMSSHTKNIDHARPNAPKRQLITRYGYGSVIGSRTNTSASVTVAPGAIVGYGSQVVTDLDTPNGVYYNDPHPWATLQRVLEPGNRYYVDVPADYQPLQLRCRVAGQIPAALPPLRHAGMTVTVAAVAAFLRDTGQLCRLVTAPGEQPEAQTLAHVTTDAAAGPGDIAWARRAEAAHGFRGALLVCPATAGGETPPVAAGSAVAECANPRLAMAAVIERFFGHLAADREPQFADPALAPAVPPPAPGCATRASGAA